VAGGVVSPFGVGTFKQGTLFELLRQHCDLGPWDELYIEDRTDAPYVVYRPNPALDIETGEWVMADPRSTKPSATLPLAIEIDQSDVVSYRVRRTDANVANIYWVDSPRFEISYGMTSKMLAFQAGLDPTAPVDASPYGNVDPQLYGWSKMQEDRQQGSPLETNNGNGTQDGDARNQNLAYALEWISLRRKQLYLQNKDNVIFESGNLRLKGNETIRAGGFVALTHGNLRSLHYAVTVEHEFIPFGNYFTSVEFDRGTGFADRIKQGDGMQNPYYSEMVQNPPVSGVPLQSSPVQFLIR
jgi:hypothetical protein